MRRSTAEDVALAVAVGLLALLDVVVPELVGSDVVGPPWAVSLGYVATSAFLVLRRRRPGLTFAVVLSLSAAMAVTLGASEGSGALVPALVATYSLAAHAPRTLALRGLALLPVVILVREVNNPQNTSVGDLVNALGWDLTVVAAWLLGGYLRTRRQLVDELAERAARAEQDQERRATEAVADERARIARELHDVVAHSITVIVVQAEAAEEMLGRDLGRAARSLQAVQRTGRDTLTEMRRLLGSLHDASPGAAGDSLHQLVAAVRDTGLEVELDVDGVGEEPGGAAGRAVHRIVQESLTNVLKHAGATRATVRVSRLNHGWSVEVADDGVGGNVAATGHGLAGMRERVSIHGGSFEAGPDRDRGFRVRAWLPTAVQQ